jgi:hypothetical protein
MACRWRDQKTPEFPAKTDPAERHPYVSPGQLISREATHNHKNSTNTRDITLTTHAQQRPVIDLLRQLLDLRSLPQLAEMVDGSRHGDSIRLTKPRRGPTGALQDRHGAAPPLPLVGNS